uniref:KIB1-4 beta-propeller domain-containing protein n=1 Tax=Ananas comosus var. bracteatus TaxID=296719 RepID=A0A6V7NRN8_ANACO|nr:unnamed protein product [Ananas comosus var. bracteatus]
MASAGDAVSLSTSTMSDAGDDEGDNVIAPANWLSLPWDLLARILSRLTCSVHYLHHLPVQPPIAFFSEFSSRGPYYNPATGIYRCLRGLPSTPTASAPPTAGSSSSAPTPPSTQSTSSPTITLASPPSSLPPPTCSNSTLKHTPLRVFSDPPGDQEVPGAVPVMVRRRDLIRLSILSSDPAEDPNFTVLIVLNHITNKYLYCRKGTDAAWAPITLPLADFQCSNLAPTRNKKIYAVDGKKEALIAFDLSDPAGSIAVSSYTISGVPRLPSPDATFLLESADGSLLLVNKIWEVRAAPYDAVLVVFRLDLSAPPQARALPVADIGASNALFVCEGESRCVDVSAFPARSRQTTSTFSVRSTATRQGRRLRPRRSASSAWRKAN